MFASFYLFITNALVLALSCQRRCEIEHNEASHNVNSLGDDLLHNLAHKSTVSELVNIFDTLNIIRPVGSQNLTRVRTVRLDCDDQGFSVSTDSFSQITVIGNKTFTNIVSESHPKRRRKLILACHYESKLKHNFYGSMDSAMPCAIILNVAKLLKSRLYIEASSFSLQLIFFDGEEAFIEWTETDSLYGSRHLADLWANTFGEDHCSKLENIALFILLDLLATSDIRIPHYGLCPEKYFQALIRTEKRLFQRSLLLGRYAHQPYFRDRVTGIIDDDHSPFSRRGVPVLHLIPIPFPPNWHQVTDDAEHIDFEKSRDISLILTVFAAEYLGLSPSSQ